MPRDDWTGFRPALDDWLTPEALPDHDPRVVTFEEVPVHPAVQEAFALVTALRAAGLTDLWHDALLDRDRQTADAIKARALALAGLETS